MKWTDSVLIQRHFNLLFNPLTIRLCAAVKSFDANITISGSFVLIAIKSNDQQFLQHKPLSPSAKVFDLFRLRDMNNYSVVTADVTTDHFGNAHNVVGNDETDFIYVVGATDTTNYTCDGKFSFYCPQTRAR